jgi:arginyl-tRNA synthetase
MKKILAQLFETTLQHVFGDALPKYDPLIQAAARVEYGDYQANFAMRLAKLLQKKPNEIAQQVIDHLNNNATFKKLELSGPGFINIFLANNFLEQQLQALTKDPLLGVTHAKHRQTIVVDYGGANVAKEMHVGHLRSAVIGDAIVRILEFLGHKVIRQNHLGDWGTQFGMLIEYMMELGEGEKAHSLRDLDGLYKKSKQRFDADAEFADKARARVVALQGGDEKTLAVWRQLVTESKHHFQKAYDRLHLLMTEDDACGESFYNDKLSALVKELETKNLATLSDDALVIFLDGFVDPGGKPLPLIVRKKDGGYLYATTDLAAIKYRVQELHGNRLIYVVDARQKQHFAMVFAAVRKAGWAENIVLEHLPYGAVLGENHRPLKTRDGESIKLNDLLDEAESRAVAVARQKNPDLSEEQIKHIANVIGIGALKYADLRSDNVKDYVFSWDRMLAFEGNTAPYLQNAYVRICAIFRKGNIDVNNLGDAPIQLTTDIEHALAIKLLEFSDLLYSVADDLSLHRLCDYLYDVASTFHKFYEHCPILSSEDQTTRSSRLQLANLTARTLKLGLGLLGINVLEMM